MRRYGRVAWRAAFGVTGRRDLADEAAQDGLLRALDNLASYDDARPFAPWLYRVVANAAVTAVERDVRARAVPVGALVAVDAPTWEGADALQVAVIALPVDQREVVVLRYWADLGIGDIAAVLDVPAGTVASRLSRALSRLRAVLGEEDR